MSFLDWSVFFLFLAYVVYDGLRRSRGTKTLEGYFGGGRSIPWWAAGLSVMATQASAITVIGTTGQGHDGGMEFVQTYLGLPFAMVLICIFLVPVYRQSPILTAYEFLERRFGPATRSLASLIFLVSRSFAFGLVILAPAVVLSHMLELPIELTVICVGGLTTLYTMAGGVHAVIWTDVKQMSVIIGGLLLCLGILLYHVLGEMRFGEALSVLGATGKLNVLETVPESMNFVPRLVGDEAGAPSFWEEKYNVWSGLLGGLFLHLSYFGCDQSQVQRILTNPTARESRMALLMSAFAKVPMQLVVLFIGVLLFLFYTLQGGPLLFNPVDRAAAEQMPAVTVLHEEYDALLAERRALALEIAVLPDGAGSDGALLTRYREVVDRSQVLRKEAIALVHPDGAVKKDTNYIFPHFIFEQIPPLLLGLIVAAIFAAAMSSSDSALNSLTAASVVDFYKRWIRPGATDRQALLVSRGITLFWGAVATSAALFLGGGDSIIEQINKIGSYFYGPLLGVFALALIVPGAGPRAGFLGLLGGMVAVAVVILTLQVAFLWYNVVGCLGVLITGLTVTLSGLERRLELDAGVTWRVGGLTAMSSPDRKPALREILILGSILVLHAGLLALYFVPLPGGSDANGYHVCARMVEQHGSFHQPMPADEFAFAGRMWVENGRDELLPKYPPVYPAIAGLLMRWLGDLGGLLLNPICAWLAVLGAYFVARAHLPGWGALLVTAAMATSPALNSFAVHQVSHPMSVAWGVWGFALFFQGVGWRRPESKPRPLLLLLSGLFLGMAAGVRYTNLVLALPIVFWLAAHRPLRRRCLAAWLLGLAVPCLLLAVYHARAFGHPLRTGYALTGEQAAFSLHYLVENLRLYLPMIVSHGVGPVSVLAACGLVAAWSHGWRQGVFHALWVLPLALVYAAYYWAPEQTEIAVVRFLIPIGLPCFVLAMMFVRAVVPAFRRQRALQIVLVAAIGLGQVAWGAIHSLREFEERYSALDLEQRRVQFLRAQVPPGSILFAEQLLINALDYYREYVLYSDDVLDRDQLALDLDLALVPGPNSLQRCRAERLAELLLSCPVSDAEQHMRDLIARHLGAGRDVYLVSNRLVVDHVEERYGDRFGLERVAVLPDGRVRHRLFKPGNTLSRVARNRPLHVPASFLVRIVAR